MVSVFGLDLNLSAELLLLIWFDPVQVENQTERTFDLVEYEVGQYIITIKTSLACERWEPSRWKLFGKGKEPFRHQYPRRGLAILLTIIGMIN